MTNENADEIAYIRKWVENVAKISDADWISSLDERKKLELEFHNRDRDRVSSPQEGTDTYDRFYGNKKYYSATGASREYTASWIREHAKQNVFLDYACGNGANAITGAKAGAAISLGIDISNISVNNAKNDADVAGVSSNTLFFQADCENTKLPDNSIDSIICSGMLHHLDLSYAFPELRRILKPGGRILAVEALNYNPLIKLYRRLTPDMRTEWEKAHILSLKDLTFAKKFFSIGEVKYWHILGIAAPHVGSFAPLLHSFDKIVTRIPLLQLMAWIFTFELVKPK